MYGLATATRPDRRPAGGRRRRVGCLIVVALVLAACGGGSEPADLGRSSTDAGGAGTAGGESEGGASADGTPAPTPAGPVHDVMIDPTTASIVEELSLAIQVPEAAFAEPLTLRLYEVDPPGGPGSEWVGDPLGPTVRIEAVDATDAAHRPSEFVTLTFTFDPATVSEPGEVVVGYFAPSRGWILLDPVEVDVHGGRATIVTDHFSFWKPTRLTTNQRVERYAKQEATAAYVRSQAVEASEAQIEAAVAQIMRDGVGVGDSRVIQIVTRAVVSKAPGGSIALALADLNAEAFGQAMLTETSKVLGEMVMDPKSPVATALGTTGSVATALGSVAAGDANAAARVIGVEVGKLFGAGNLILIGQTAAQIVDHVVKDLWLEPSIEKAFEVYRDGADEVYGYSVSPGDFEAVLEQMSPGALRQYHMNYRRTYALARGIDPESLSSTQRRQLEQEAEAKLKERFDSRIARGPEIAAREEGILAMFEAFRNRGMFYADTATNPMIAEGADVSIEMLMHRIMEFASKVQRDTERFSVLPDDTFAQRGDDGTALPAYVIASAALAWYTASPEDRDRAYRDVLIAEGFLAPDEERELDDLAAMLLAYAEFMCFYRQLLADGSAVIDGETFTDVAEWDRVLVQQEWNWELTLEPAGYDEFEVGVVMACLCPQLESVVAEDCVHLDDVLYRD